MLGFKREYGFGKNLATAVCYSAATDFIQAQFTGQYLSEHLGTKITDIPAWIGTLCSFLTGVVGRCHFSRVNSRKERDYKLIKTLEEIDL
jgi:hypothetical protein